MVSDFSRTVASNFDVNQSNWAIQGWGSTAGYSTEGSGFGFTTNTSAAFVDHIAFINNVAWHNASAYTTNSQGATCTQFTPGIQYYGCGIDYWAVVGNIAQDSAGRNDGFADAAIDIIGIANKDAVSGTHIFVSGNFSYNNQQTAGGMPYDGEDYMFDTIDGGNYNQKIVMKNNVGILAERFGLEMFYQGYSNNTPLMNIYNNTWYADNHGAYTASTQASSLGTIDIHSGPGSTWPWLLHLYDNISMTNEATNPGKNDLYAMLMGGTFPSPVIGDQGTNPADSQNIFKGLDANSCWPAPGACAGPDDDVLAPHGGNLGANFYIDPTFKNTADLLNKRMGAPNCSGFPNVAACMGWDFASQTASNPSIIYDLTPTALQAVGKGYQPPRACAPDADYPTWLKGMVYLQASGFVAGATIAENQGLITRPCE